MGTIEKLQTLIDKNPALIFHNDGYQDLPKDVVDTHKEAIAQIEAVLKAVALGFVSFQNFKRMKDWSILVRYQVYYNVEKTFIGVAYTPLSDLD